MRACPTHLLFALFVIIYYAVYVHNCKLNGLASVRANGTKAVHYNYYNYIVLVQSVLYNTFVMYYS